MSRARHFFLTLRFRSATFHRSPPKSSVRKRSASHGWAQPTGESQQPSVQGKPMNSRKSMPAIVAAFVTAIIASPAQADLLEYVKKPDNSFEWKLKQKIEKDEGTIYDLHLVSQTWQNIKWEHQLQIYVPKGVKPTETMVLYNQGGKA